MFERTVKLDEGAVAQAKEILSFYKFYKLNGQLYLSDDTQALDDLFEAVVLAIGQSSALSVYLPFQEFIHPSREVLRGDAGWVGHFQERDNRRFFLSDIYDFLRLFFALKGI